MTYEFSKDVYSGRVTVIFSSAAKLRLNFHKKTCLYSTSAPRKIFAFVLSSSLKPRLSEKRTTRCFKFNNVYRPTRRSLAISKNIALFHTVSENRRKILNTRCSVKINRFGGKISKNYHWRSIKHPANGSYCHADYYVSFLQASSVIESEAQRFNFVFVTRIRRVQFSRV